MIKRVCTECNGPLILLISTCQKVCADCGKVHKWDLDEGQEPIIDGKR